MKKWFYTTWQIPGFVLFTSAVRFLTEEELVKELSSEQLYEVRNYDFHLFELTPEGKKIERSDLIKDITKKITNVPG